MGDIASMKALITIWFLVLITLILGFWWMNKQIDQDIHKSVLNKLSDRSVSDYDIIKSWNYVPGLDVSSQRLYLQANSAKNIINGTAGNIILQICGVTQGQSTGTGDLTQMDMSTYDLAPVNQWSRNIDTLCRKSWGDSSLKASQSTTLTATEPIIDQKTWSCGLRPSVEDNELGTCTVPTAEKVTANSSYVCCVGDFDLHVTKPELYTITSYGTVRLQLTASDASHQWGDNPMQDMDMDSRKLQGSQ